MPDSELLAFPQGVEKVTPNDDSIVLPRHRGTATSYHLPT
jgi:hypothetical protein